MTAKTSKFEQLFNICECTYRDYRFCEKKKIIVSAYSRGQDIPALEPDPLLTLREEPVVARGALTSLEIQKRGKK